VQIKINNDEIIIAGSIKTIDDGEHLKKTIYLSMSNAIKNRLAIHIIDSSIITSYIINMLLKAVKHDSLHLTLYVYQEDLYELFCHLELMEELNIVKA